MYHNPSKDWDSKEKKMDEADIKNSEGDDKEEVNVVTEQKEEPSDIPFSGMFCTICRDHATFLFEGDSLCWKHYDDKLADIIKKHKESK
jgi:hypothetical protein